MKKLLCVSLLCILLTGCGSSNSYKTISAEEAKNMMDENTVIVDVRTEAEYEIEHIKNAINIPLDTIDESIEEILNEKDQTILVYCQSGNRSAQASQKLVDLGYKKIYNFGGINEWKGETYSPKKDSNEVLLKQIISAVKVAYLNEVMEGNTTLPFKVVCDGSKCVYGSDKTLSLSGTIIPTGTITLSSESKVEPVDGISLGGYNCAIKENETVICQ